MEQEGGSSSEMDPLKRSALANTRVLDCPASSLDSITSGLFLTKYGP